MHPIQELIFELLDEEQDSYSISEGAVQQVLAQVIAQRGAQELPLTVASIVAYANFLHAECSSPAAAARLMAVAVTATPWVEAVVAQAQAKGAERAAKKRFTRFSGRADLSRVAPRLDAPPKSGLTLGGLRPRTVFR